MQENAECIVACITECAMCVGVRRGLVSELSNEFFIPYTNNIQSRIQCSIKMAERIIKPNFHRIEINHTNWEVPERYQDLMALGVGAFGSVW